MTNLRLALACGDYDRTRSLEDGTVRADGIDLTYLRLPVEETFFRMMRHREFEISEMSLSSYVVSMQADPSPFVAIPVFTSRMFRHGSIYVNANAGIESPADLRGKIVGTPEYQLTAGVWVRGILADNFGVPADSVDYLTGGQESPGRIEKAGVNPPANINIRSIPSDKMLSKMLVNGEIDALYTPRIPQPFMERDPRVRRLFPDVISAEKAYYAQSGIFPIMHVVVMRRDIYESYPWVAQSLYKAFVAAKQKAVESFHDSSALRFMLPWMIQHFQEDQELLGDDYWSYGLTDANANALSTFLRYHHEQGLSKHLLQPKHLFAPESLESAVI